jgi:hypothetical protein
MGLLPPWPASSFSDVLGGRTSPGFSPGNGASTADFDIEDFPDLALRPFLALDDDVDEILSGLERAGEPERDVHRFLIFHVCGGEGLAFDEDVPSRPFVFVDAEFELEVDLELAFAVLPEMQESGRDKNDKLFFRGVAREAIDLAKEGIERKLDKNKKLTAAALCAFAPRAAKINPAERTCIRLTLVLH